MKLIHISDLHIDSKMETNFTPLVAKARNNEILVTLEKLFSLMETENYHGMIISGDLFDTKKVSSKAFSYIIDLMRAHTSKHFFYVPGNHDNESLMLRECNTIPSNLHIFDTTFSQVEIDDVCIGGVQLSSSNCTTFSEQIDFDPEKINIMLLHGAITKSISSVSNSSFHLSQVKNKNIDYLALGHIHEYSCGKLDNRGTYVYSGCLEPRGFDELGPKGFVCVNIDEQAHTINHEFIEFSSRTIHEVQVDISNTNSSREILNKIYSLCSDMPSDDIIKVVLTGTYNTNLIKTPSLIQEELNGKFYYVKIVDKSKLEIDIKEYENDISLKGCFIRKVLASKLSEKDKAEVIETGLKALGGEDLLS